MIIPSKTSELRAVFVTLLIGPLLITCQEPPETSAPPRPPEVSTPPGVPPAPTPAPAEPLPQPPAGGGIDGGPGYDL